MTLRIFLFDDGEIGVTVDELVDGDLDSVAEGVLEILEIDEEFIVTSLQTNGEKLVIEEMETYHEKECSYHNRK